MRRAPVLYSLLVRVGWPLALLLYRPRATGREHLPRGGFVVAPNHVSGFDSIALAFALRGRSVRSMGKAQLFARPFVGPLVRGLGAFPASGGIDIAVRLAGEGHVVAIFPEGARRRPDRVHRPRTGAARIALAAGVPLVPAAIRGTKGWRRFGRWQLAFGAPVETADLAALAAHEAAREATRRLWDSVAALERQFA